jgi:hypothetical protein
MPRRDDEFDDDDDRPRRRRPRDDFDDDDRGPPRKKKSNTGLILGILIGVFVLCCGGGGTVIYIFVVRAKKVVEEVKTGVQEGMESEQSRVNLVQIGRGIHNHADATNTLPADSRENPMLKGGGPVGKPLLSWRVHLLPYIGEEALYHRFKLDEQWDSANNKPLLAQMPAIYGTPEANKRAGPGKTYYRGFTHKGAAFEKVPVQDNRVRFPAGFPDGTSNTILIVEAGDPVDWTKPDDFEWGPGRARPNLGGSARNSRISMCSWGTAMSANCAAMCRTRPSCGSSTGKTET